jgi:O6-methylguanine-DNA--protein-cysteine methyltransferase
MVNDRRVSPGEIIRYVNEMQREIDELEKRLQALRAAAGGGGGTSAAPAPRRRGRPPGSRNRAKAAAPAAAAAAAPAAAKGGRRRRRSKITAEQLASRQLQGRYLGLIRQIPASRRGQYQKTAKEKGREAAIKDMQSALGK